MWNNCMTVVGLTDSEIGTTGRDACWSILMQRWNLRNYIVVAGILRGSHACVCGPTNRLREESVFCVPFYFPWSFGKMNRPTDLISKRNSKFVSLVLIALFWFTDQIGLHCWGMLTMLFRVNNLTVHWFRRELRFVHRRSQGGAQGAWAPPSEPSSCLIVNYHRSLNRWPRKKLLKWAGQKFARAKARVPYFQHALSTPIAEILGSPLFVCKVCPNCTPLVCTDNQLSTYIGNNMNITL